MQHTCLLVTWCTQRGAVHPAQIVATAGLTGSGTWNQVSGTRGACLEEPCMIKVARCFVVGGWDGDRFICPVVSHMTHLTQGLAMLYRILHTSLK